MAVKAVATASAVAAAKTVGEGAAATLAPTAMGNHGGRQRWGQTTTNQKAVEMAVEATAMAAAAAEAKTAAEGHRQR
jgi:hypothetical protein